MYLENATIFHIVDEDTKFSAASFLAKEIADETWNGLMRIWLCVHTGFLDVIAIDQIPQCTSQRWKTLLVLEGIKQNISGVKIHNALRVGERYYAYLRGIYREVRH